MKFIHAADLHLDSPFQGLQQLPKALWQRVHDAPFNATRQMVDDAIKEHVDFVLLAGDLFDRETQSVQAQTFLNQQIQRLLDADIDVVVGFGNHDFVNEHNQLDLPEGTRVFGEHIETFTLTTKDHLRIAISGFSYHDRWIDHDMINEFPHRSDADFQIGVLHGALKQADVNHYAPFTLADMTAKNYDYWALGHIHKPESLAEQPPIVYAGTIQGRHKLETGAHGYQLVTSVNQQLTPKFVAVDQIRWRTVNLTVNDDTTDAALIEQVSEALTTIHPPVFELIELQLDHIESLSAGLLSRLTDGTWQARFDQMQQESYQTNQCWVYDINLQSAQQQIEYAKLDSTFWQSAKDEVFTQDNLELTAGKLMQYPFLADHLQDPATVTKITNQAQNELLAQSEMEAESDENHKA